MRRSRGKTATGGVSGVRPALLWRLPPRPPSPTAPVKEAPGVPPESPTHQGPTRPGLPVVTHTLGDTSVGRVRVVGPPRAVGRAPRRLQAPVAVTLVVGLPPGPIHLPGSNPGTRSKEVPPATVPRSIPTMSRLPGSCGTVGRPVTLLRPSHHPHTPEWVRPTTVTRDHRPTPGPRRPQDDPSRSTDRGVKGGKGEDGGDRTIRKGKAKKGRKKTETVGYGPTRWRQRGRRDHIDTGDKTVTEGTDGEGATGGHDKRTQGGK